MHGEELFDQFMVLLISKLYINFYVADMLKCNAHFPN